MWTALILSALLQRGPMLPSTVTVAASEPFLLHRQLTTQQLMNFRVWDRESASFRPMTPAEKVTPRQLAVVHLWADYCVPCLDELPLLVRVVQKLERKYNGSVRFLFVTETLAADDLKRFLERNPKALPPSVTLYQDTAGTFFQSLREELPATRSPYLPATLLLDQSLTIRQAIVGPTNGRYEELIEGIERLRQHDTQNGNQP